MAVTAAAKKPRRRQQHLDQTPAPDFGLLARAGNPRPLSCSGLDHRWLKAGGGSMSTVGREIAASAVPLPHPFLSPFVSLGTLEPAGCPFISLSSPLTPTPQVRSHPKFRFTSRTPPPPPVRAKRRRQPQEAATTLGGSRRERENDRQARFPVFSLPGLRWSGSKGCAQKRCPRPARFLPWAKRRGPLAPRGLLLMKDQESDRLCFVVQYIEVGL